MRRRSRARPERRLHARWSAARAARCGCSSPQRQRRGEHVASRGEHAGARGPDIANGAGRERDTRRCRLRSPRTGSACLSAARVDADGAAHDGQGRADRRRDAWRSPSSGPERRGTEKVGVRSHRRRRHVHRERAGGALEADHARLPGVLRGRRLRRAGERRGDRRGGRQLARHPAADQAERDDHSCADGSAGPVPPRGVVVELLVHYRGRWEPFRDPRDRQARALPRCDTSFQGAVGRFPFRAEILGGQAGFPYARRGEPAGRRSDPMRCARSAAGLLSPRRGRHDRCARSARRARPREADDRLQLPRPGRATPSATTAGANQRTADVRHVRAGLLRGAAGRAR